MLRIKFAYANLALIVAKRFIFFEEKDEAFTNKKIPEMAISWFCF